MCDTERTCIECELPVDRNGDTLTNCWGESPSACPTSPRSPAWCGEASNGA